jgi:hypothetical protein
VRNAKINTTIKQVVYGITRRWGTAATIYRILDSSTDYVTGEKTRTVQTRGLRNVVPLSDSQRRAIYESGAYLQQGRPFTWKGGQGADIHTRIFLILGSDLRDWKPDVHHWIVFEGLQYEVYMADRLGDFVAWILSTRASASQDMGTVLSVDETDELNIEQATEESNGP